MLQDAKPYQSVGICQIKIGYKPMLLKAAFHKMSFLVAA